MIQRIHVVIDVPDPLGFGRRTAENRVRTILKACKSIPAEYSILPPDEETETEEPT